MKFSSSRKFFKKYPEPFITLADVTLARTNILLNGLLKNNRLPKGHSAVARDNYTEYYFDFFRSHGVPGDIPLPHVPSRGLGLPLRHDPDLGPCNGALFSSVKVSGQA